MILGLRTDQRYSQRICKFKHDRINFKFRTSKEKNNTLHTICWHNGEGADRTVVVEKFFFTSSISPLKTAQHLKRHKFTLHVPICVARGFGLHFG